MINSNELRIGNYISDIWASEGSMWPVLKVSEKIVKYGYTRIKHPITYKCVWDNAVAIPITEEILLKFGLKKSSEFGGYNLYILTDEIEINPNGVVSCGDDGYHGKLDISNIDYVHQLQNLYFALTGQELVFNE